MRFNNISIIWKISILLLLLGTVSVGGALFAGAQMAEARQKYEYLMDGPQAAAVHLARSTRMAFRAGIAMLNNVNAMDPAAVQQSAARMNTEINNALDRMEAAAKAAPNFAAEIRDLAQKTSNVLKGTCGDIVQAAVTARQAGDMSRVIESMRTVCSARLDEVADASVALNARVSTYVDEQGAELGADISRMQVIVVASIALATLAVLALAILLVRSGIVRPIGAMIATMAGLGRGELDKKVDGTERKDEIGNLANGLEVLRVQLQEAETVRRETAAREEADRQTLARRERLAQSFVAKMQNIAGQFAQSSGEVAGSARNLSATAEETSRQAQAVAAAAEQAASNVQTVAASSEELAASVREISGRVFHSAEVANVAFREAEASNARIAELAQAAKAIGDVISLIKGIADQTNLLALNATIESARAGEAGKGFAVVASEVKELASQTAKATDDIAAKVMEIQQATDGTVASMAEIIRVVGDIKSISTTIAGAVEEQGAATGEIAQNCQQAATGTQQVTDNITGVGRAAEMTGAASSQLLGLSEGLSRQAGDLRQEVESFVTQLQAA